MSNTAHKPSIATCSRCLPSSGSESSPFNRADTKSGYSACMRLQSACAILSLRLAYNPPHRPDGCGFSAPRRRVVSCKSGMLSLTKPRCPILCFRKCNFSSDHDACTLKHSSHVRWRGLHGSDTGRINSLLQTRHWYSSGTFMLPRCTAINPSSGPLHCTTA